MSSRRAKLKNGTLFDSEFLNRFGFYHSSNVPYSIQLTALRDFYPQTVPEDELSAFCDVLEHEICAYEPRGMLYGPLCLVDALQGRKRVNYARQPQCMPTFVEPDVLSIHRCDASDLVLVDDFWVFESLSQSPAFAEMGILLMTGSGIPRFGARRFLHRLERECGLRIHMVTDNDTWGYWIYSVLKRGLLAPGMETRFTAIKNVSFLGARAGDWRTFGVPVERLRPWQKQWDLRLKELRKQKCFKALKWQNELRRFAKDGCGLDLRVLVEHLGVDEFVSTFLQPRLKKTSGR